MEFSIDRHVLLEPLKQVAAGLPSKSHIPILHEILFVANDQGLVIIAGDEDVMMKAEISPDDFQLVSSGAITLPGKKIVEIIDKITDDITFTSRDFQTVIKSGSSKFDLVGMDADEYPSFSEVVGQSVKLPGRILKNLIQKTIHAVSINESTPILTGIYFQFSENKIKLIACDRHRLARIEHEIENGFDANIVVGGTNLNKLLKIIDDKNEVTLSFSGNIFFATTKGRTFSSRILDGAYPDAEKLIFDKSRNLITFPTNKMKDALERSNIIAKDEKTFKTIVTFSKEIEIATKTGTNNSSESVDITKREGEDNLKVSLNLKYLLDAMKVIDSENTTFHINGVFEPIIIKERDEGNNLQVILPYRTEPVARDGK